MIIGGIVKKAELIKLGNWNESMMIITLDVSGKEFLFPVETNMVPLIEIDKFIKFNLSAEVDNGYGVVQLSEPELPDKKAETQNSITLKERESEFSDEEIKELYGIKNSPTDIVLIPRVESRLEEVSKEEYQKTLDQESVNEQREQKNKGEEKTINEMSNKSSDDEPSETATSDSSNKGMSSNFMDFMSNGFIPTKNSDEDDEEDNE